MGSPRDTFCYTPTEPLHLPCMLETDVTSGDLQPSANHSKHPTSSPSLSAPKFHTWQNIIFLTSKRWRRSWMLMCKVTHISPSGYLERFNAGEQGDLLQDCVMPPCPSQSDSQEVKPCRVCTQAEPHPTIRQTNHVCTAMEEKFEDSLLCEPEAGRCCCRAGTAVVLGTGPHFDSAENRRE